MRLSVLNFFSYPDACVELAQLCEAEGCFERFWIGEHHTAGQVPDPLTLSLLIAGVTEKIRVGTGAIALSFRNPYHVAETAFMGELFFPGRLDVGVTKGGIFGADPALGPILLDGLREDDPGVYERRLHLLRDVLAREAPIRSAFLVQVLPTRPPLFVMGLSAERARHAGELGAGFVASFHHGGTVEQIREMLAIYRAAFRPGPLLAEPVAIAVVSGHVSEVGEVVDTLRAAEMRTRAANVGGMARTVGIFGGPDDSARELRRLGAEIGADEIMFLSLEQDDVAPCYRALAAGWRATA